MKDEFLSLGQSAEKFMETQKATEDKYKKCKMREREAIQLLRDATHKLESLQNNLKQEKLKSANLQLRNEALEE